MRRRRDRFKQRQTALLNHLTRDGLLPSDPVAKKKLESLDPYHLRASALDGPLPLHHLGRAIFHLNQRRGFRSNRKANRNGKDDEGMISNGIARLHAAIEGSGARTYGEFLHLRRSGALDKNHIPSVRARPRGEAEEGATGDGYDFYPSRALLEEEFNAIWEVQSSYYPDSLTKEVHDRLFEIVFYQRPLKKPEIGRCLFIRDEERLHKSHPLFQQRRILEELNSLKILRPGQVEQGLTRAQRDLLLLKLKDKKEVSFEILKKALGLEGNASLNKESDHRLKLKGDEVAALMVNKKRFGQRWHSLSTEDQWAVLDRVIKIEDDNSEAEVRSWLESSYQLGPDQSLEITTSGDRLPKGYGRLGLTATRLLVDVLRDETVNGHVIVYSEAVQRAGLGHHSDHRTGEVHAELPYYGIPLERHIMPGTGDPSDPAEMRIGRLTNPTVHIGLNQLRRVVNALIRIYGRPHEVAIELARELKQTEEEKKRSSRESNLNRIAAEQRSKKLIEIGVPDTGANRARLKLWEELNPSNVLDRRCPYTGEQISIEMLFSDLVEVDHILPFTGTLDDSNANKTVCLRTANRVKGNRSPYEAWGHVDSWDGIAARAARFPKNKRWRFSPDAMDRFRDEGGFLARHLVDTQYLSRLAREYLEALYPERGQGSSRVWASPGKLTELVRRKLGLNELLPDHNYAGSDPSKNRLDHRHHAIDAVVTAVIDRSLLQGVAKLSGKDGSDGREKVVIPEPWTGFRDDLRNSLDRITVSHRPDHGTVTMAGRSGGKGTTAARLHNETAYGITGEVDEKGNSIVVSRTTLSSFKKRADIERIRDTKLRQILLECTRGQEGKAFEMTMQEFGRHAPAPFRGIQRVRVTEPLKVIPIRDKSGRAYKGYKGDSNSRYDVWELSDGKWVPEVISMFDAHQRDWTSSVRSDHPTARKVLSLRQNDVIAIESAEEGKLLMRVVKFGQNGQITLAATHEAGDLKRRDAAPIDRDPFKYIAPTAGGLKKLRARQVRIDELGRVWDPGFPARKAIRRTLRTRS